VKTRAQGYEQLTFLLFLKMADEQSRPTGKAFRGEDGWRRIIATCSNRCGREGMRLGVLLVNLENVGEGSKMLDAEATTAKMDQQAIPAFPVEDLESGKIAINPGWVKEVWGKWPAPSPSRNCSRL
jgi:hypothetical protein